MFRFNVTSCVSLLLILFCATSCSDKYKIEGKSSITSLDGKKLFLKLLQDGQWVSVDSAEVVHGLFKMKGGVDSVRMATLFMDDEGIMPLVLEDGTIKVSLSNTQLVAGGTSLNDRLYEFIDKRNRLEIKIGELERKEARMVLEGANLEEVNEQLNQERENLLKETNDNVYTFITENFENVLGPSVFMMMCSTLPYPCMTKEVEVVMRTAPLSFKNDPLVKDYLQKAKENMKLIEEHQRLEENKILTANRANAGAYPVN